MEIEVTPLKEALAVQGQNGNWNSDAYMLGMYNGMEFMMACIENREPQYRDKPEAGFTSDTHPSSGAPVEAPCPAPTN